MDSRGSKPPMRAPVSTPGTDALTSRPAGGDATRRRPVEIPEFRNVEHRPDGSWRAVHKLSGDVISADTFERLERVEAPIVRLAYGWRRAS